MEKKSTSQISFDDFLLKINFVLWPFLFFITGNLKYKAMVTFPNVIFYRNKKEYIVANRIWSDILSSSLPGTQESNTYYDYKDLYLVLHEVGHVYQILMYGYRRILFTYIYEAWIKRLPHHKRYMERDADIFAKTLVRRSPFEIRFILQNRFRQAIRLRNKEINKMQYQL